MPNRLAGETSPYLRQHADNPVDWYPWGPEAFAKAKAEQKPIFLSIGYSTCHWCHVMAHESFESPAVAAFLREHFVAIKVDREERPDVDRVYMAYVQAITGHGGWPLSAWLTPDLKPFFGGTYFPPEDRHQRPGFPSILAGIAQAWQDERPKLLEEGDRVLEALSRVRETEGADELQVDQLRAEGERSETEAFRQLAASFDAARGGFGGAPKFPRASNLTFLLRFAAKAGVGQPAGREAIGLVARTLQAMARGGIHDHVGGGFHRYSVDADWFVPHFEKMLYDQAQIALNALEAWQATQDERHAWLARDIFDYVLRDLAHPAGGFYSAEDADSAVAEGEHAVEGAFYVWTQEEIETALEPRDAALICAHYGVKREGNVPAERDPFSEFVGKNILAQTRSLAETAQAAGWPLQDASDRLVASLAMLREVRATRPRPQRDDKILTAWNGLMISALARAAVVPAESLAEHRAASLAAAIRAAEFVQRELFDPARGVLYRSWRESRGAAEGFAEDYAYFIQGLIDLYEATFDLRWLEWADRLQVKMDELFWDAAGGGYFNSAAGAADVLVRLKDDYDGAEPTSSSVAALNLLRLAAVFDLADGTRRAQAVRLLAAFRFRWLEYPQALPQMLCAFAPAFAPPQQVVLAGDPAAEDFRALAAVLAERLGPLRSVLAMDGSPGAQRLAASRPWLAAMLPKDGRATAYVCQDFMCQAPVTSPEELRALLRG